MLKLASRKWVVFDFWKTNKKIFGATVCAVQPSLSLIGLSLRGVSWEGDLLSPTAGRTCSAAGLRWFGQLQGGGPCTTPQPEQLASRASAQRERAGSDELTCDLEYMHRPAGRCNKPSAATAQVQCSHRQLSSYKNLFLIFFLFLHWHALERARVMHS